ncbi:unnamed protein product [Blepharisma stoltei]|uniref:UBC core domain-containing protein n=1 Tax=Blepharisma stoltei TaxID=1481888 RepID=A0AAU9IM89_9CILI|nr:unnamed protein product [Blepharisma stoltei]
MERLTNEFNNLLEIPEPCITVNLVDQSLFHWRGTLNGPDESPYEGGMFKFEITFPSNFPASPPTFYFKTKIFHPNVHPSDGRICCEIFNSGWKPKVTVRTVISYVIALLYNPSPNGFSTEINTLCAQNMDLYNQRAREWTQQYAMG